MATDKISASASGVRGRVSLWRVAEPSGARTLLHSQPNLILYSWGHIAARQLGFRRQAGRPDYHISAMYLEFENLASPSSTVTVPTFTRELGLDYFNELSDSATRDFLRVPMRLEPTLGISTGFESYFTDGVDGNQLTFFVQTSGVTGVHGKTFSHSVNSKIYAATLVAAPVFSDRTQDVVFARTAFSGANQVTKEASSQIGITWDIAFE
jgi:hypothetical protein